MTGIGRSLRFVSKLLAGAGMAAMALMMLHVSLDVISKYVWSQPIVGTLETVSSYYMVALLFLPLAEVSRRCQHIRVEVFTSWLAPRPLAACVAIGLAICAAYGGMMAWRGGVEAMRMTAIREAWETALWDMEVWPARWFVPIGCAAMSLVFVMQALERAWFAASGSPLSSEEGRTPLL
jgi:TRAP-type C4-dicarboxylate transport system permease small subunit